MKKALPLLLTTVLLVGLGFALWWSPQQVPDGPGTRLAPVPSGGDFVLQSLAGPVSLRDLRGKVVVLYFGYTACPDICPTSLALLTNALERLSEPELEQVQVLFISVDPQRDTLERLQEYAAYFHPNILGITGTSEQVARVAALYGAAYRRTEVSSAMDYVVDHSAYLYLIDRRGRLYQTLPHGTPPERIVQVLREGLAEQGRPSGGQRPGQ